MKNPNTAAEFSYLIEVMQLPQSGREYKVQADAEACARVATRLDLKAVERLSIEARLRPAGDGMVSVIGQVNADVVQTCVVSLGPVPAKVADKFSLAFAMRPMEMEDADDEVEILLSDDDMPDVVVDGRIDLGEVAVEQLALALNPYPRAPGVTFDQEAWLEDPETVEKPSQNNPFAALVHLKKPPKG